MYVWQGPGEATALLQIAGEQNAESPALATHLVATHVSTLSLRSLLCLKPPPNAPRISPFSKPAAAAASSSTCVTSNTTCSSKFRTRPRICQELKAVKHQATMRVPGITQRGTSVFLVQVPGACYPPHTGLGTGLQVQVGQHTPSASFYACRFPTTFFYRLRCTCRHALGVACLWIWTLNTNWCVLLVCPQRVLTNWDCPVGLANRAWTFVSGNAGLQRTRYRRQFQDDLQTEPRNRQTEL